MTHFKPYDLTFALCTPLTPFKSFDSFQDHMIWFLHCVPNWLLSRASDLILSLCTQLTALNTILLAFVLCTQLTPFKTIWPNLSICTQLTPFKTIWPDFYIVYPIYPIDSFQEHMIWFLHCVPNWLLSRPSDLILSLCSQLTALNTILLDFVLCTQLTPFKAIWPNFIIVYPIDPIQDHMTWFLHCVSNLPNWLLSRPCELIFALCTQLTAFKTIWPDFCIMYLIDSFKN